MPNFFDDLFSPTSTIETTPIKLGEIEPTVKSYSDQFGVDFNLSSALIQQESGGDPSALSGAGAVGLMQIMPGTAKAIAEELGEEYSDEKLKDPDTNIRWGTYHLKTLLDKFGGDELKALAGYHAGEGAVRKAEEKGQRIPESYDAYAGISTKDYVKSIMSKKGTPVDYKDFQPENIFEGLFEGQHMTVVAQPETIEQPREDVPREIEGFEKTPPITEQLAVKPEPAVVGTTGVEPPPTEPTFEERLGATAKAVPKETIALTRGLVAEGVEAIIGVPAVVSKLVSGIGSAVDDFIQTGDPETAVEGFKQGFQGERDVLGKSAKWWEEKGAQWGEAIKGEAKTKGEEFQQKMASDMLNAYFILAGGTAILKALPKTGNFVKTTAQGMVNKAKLSSKVLKNLKLTEDELRLVKQVHQGFGGKTVKDLTPRTRAFYNSVLKDATTLRAKALRTGEIRDIVSPWEAPKWGKVKKGKAPLPERVALPTPEAPLVGKPPAIVAEKVAPSNVDDMVENLLAEGGIYTKEMIRKGRVPVSEKVITPTKETKFVSKGIAKVAPRRIPTEEELAKLPPPGKEAEPQLAERKVTPKELAETLTKIPTREEAQDKITDIIGIKEKRLSELDEGAKFASDEEKKLYNLAEKYSADLEHSIIEKDFNETEQIIKAIEAEKEKISAKRKGAAVSPTGKKAPVQPEIKPEPVATKVLQKKEPVTKEISKMSEKEIRKELRSLEHQEELVGRAFAESEEKGNYGIDYDEAAFATDLRTGEFSEKITKTGKKGKLKGKTYESLVLGKGLSKLDWDVLTGKTTGKRSAELNKKLNEIAADWNTTKANLDDAVERGLGIDRADEPIQRILDQKDNWNADDVARVLQKATSKSELVKMKREIELTREAKGEEVYKAFEELGKKREAIENRIQEISMLTKRADRVITNLTQRYKGIVKFEKDLPPEDLNDLSIYGATEIAKGVNDYAEWSQNMEKKFGFTIRRHLKSIWDKAKQIFSDIIDTLKSESGAVRFPEGKPKQPKPKVKKPRPKKASFEVFKLPTMDLTTPKQKVPAAAKKIHEEWVSGKQVMLFESDRAINKIQQQLKGKEKEVIPFLIERTGIPTKFDRPDLEKIIADPARRQRLTKVAEQSKKHMNEVFQYVKKHRPDMSQYEKENYVTHIWDIPKNKVKEAVNWFTTYDPFLKKRFIQTLEEGIKRGYKPKTLDITEIMKIHDQYHIKVTENLKFAEALNKLQNKAGMKAIMRADKAPNDWITSDHPALRRVAAIGKTKVVVPVKSFHTTINETIFKLKNIEGGGKIEVSQPIKKLEQVLKDALTSRGMTEGEAKAYLNKLKTVYTGKNVGEGKITETEQRTINEVVKEVKEKYTVDVPILMRLPVKYHPDLDPLMKSVFGKKITATPIQIYEAFNGVQKQMQLGFSLFHHLALGETAVATISPVQTAKIYLNAKKLYNALAKGRYDIYEEKFEAAKDGIQHGLQIGAITDVHRGLIVDILKGLETRLNEVHKGFGIPVKGIRKGKELWDNALWDYLHNNLKVYAYENLKTKMIASAKNATGKDITAIKKEVAQMVNDTFGGQNWERMMTNPRNLQIAQWGLLSPDWTLSTVKQALAPTGLGAVSKESAKYRRKMGRAFWAKAFIYFGVGINALNFVLSKRDDAKQRGVPFSEGRGVFLWQNDPGHKTHLFEGRYADGSKRYRRWGKQFRELPELFYDQTAGQVSPVTATLRKLGSKAAPNLQLLSTIFTGSSLGGFRNKELADNSGWSWVGAATKEIIKAPLPFAFKNTMNESKEFSFLDLSMPASKGMTYYKTKKLFKVAIVKRNMKHMTNIYKAAVENQLNAADIWKDAITELKREATAEISRKMRGGKIKEPKNIQELKAMTREEKRVLENKVMLDNWEILILSAEERYHKYLIEKNLGEEPFVKEKK